MDAQWSSSDWVNLYTVTGITPGAGIEVQNKNSTLVTVQESATQPASNDFSGRLLRYCDTAEVWAGSPGVWVRGATNSIWLNVQVVPS